MDEYGFESRLRHLEHILVGQQSHQLTKTTSDSIYKRLDAIQKELNSVYKNNKPVKEFVAKCQFP